MRPRALAIRIAMIFVLSAGVPMLSACALIDEGAELDPRVLDAPDTPSSRDSEFPGSARRR